MLKLELPMQPSVIRHAGRMLTELADTLDHDGAVGTVGSSTEGVQITEEAAAAPPAAAPPAAAPPAAAPPAAAPPAAGVERDLAGYPWDTRINPDSKGKLATGARAGCWKYKRKLEPEYIAEVEAELLAAMSAAPPAAAPPATAAVDAGEPATLPPVPVPPVAGPPIADFPAALCKVTELINAQRINADQINGIVAPWGLAQFNLLATRPDLIPNFIAELDKLCPPIQ